MNGLIQSAFCTAIYESYTDEDFDWIDDEAVEDLLTFVDDETLIKNHTIEKIERFTNAQ